MAEIAINRGDRVEGAHGFVEILLSLGVLTKNLRPRRQCENAAVVAKFVGRSEHVRRHWQAAQAEIADGVGHAAVEEYRAVNVCGDAMRIHVEANHQFGESRRIEPGQGAATHCLLLPDNGAAGFRHRRKAGFGKAAIRVVLPAPGPPVSTKKRSESTDIAAP